MRPKDIQRYAAVTIAVCCGVFVGSLNDFVLMADFLIGLVFGAIMVKVNFSFAGFLREPILRRNFYYTKLFFILSVVACIGMNGVILYKNMNGQFDWIQYSNEPTRVSVYFFFAAVVFGIGMNLMGCGGSGLIKNVSHLQGDYIIALLFYFVGSVFGVICREFCLNHFFYEQSVYMPDLFGWQLAVLIQAMLYIVTAMLILGYDENHFLRKSFNTKLLFNSFKPFHGVLVIAAISVLYFAVNDRVISTAMPLSLVGYRLMNLGGMDTSSWFEGTKLIKQISASYLSSSSLVFITGFAIGCIIIKLVEGHYKPSAPSFRHPKTLVRVIIGGFTLGFGVQGIYGANIGEVFGAISMLSLSGWLVVPFIILGIWLSKPLLNHLEN